MERGGEIADRRESVNSNQGDDGQQQEYRAGNFFMFIVAPCILLFISVTGSF